MLMRCILTITLVALLLPVPTWAEWGSVSYSTDNGTVSLEAQRAERKRSGGGRGSGGGSPAGVGDQTSEQLKYEWAEVDGRTVRLYPRRPKPPAVIPECWEGAQELVKCRIVPDEEPSDQAAPVAAPSRERVERTVRSLVSRMELPVPTPLVGPDPSVNEWNMAVVGYPLWLWTDDPGSMSSTVTGNGITITINARRGATTFDMGDGGKVVCTQMSAYRASVKPATPSPTCGYVYGWPSLPKGTYAVTASSAWVVDWSALGFEGTIPVTVTASRQLPVGELHAVVVR